MGGPSGQAGAVSSAGVSRGDPAVEAAHRHPPADPARARDAAAGGAEGHQFFGIRDTDSYFGD